jgi:hypothetical protein
MHRVYQLRIRPGFSERPVAQLFIDCAREVAKPLTAGKSASARRRQREDEFGITSNDRLWP